MTKGASQCEVIKAVTLATQGLTQQSAMLLTQSHIHSL